MKEELLGLLSGKEGYNLKLNTWKSLVIKNLHQIDWKVVQKEMEFLIEDRDELGVFTRDNLLLLLNQ